jgi:beta-galactosidase/beta-glucuronidase
MVRRSHTELFRSRPPPKERVAGYPRPLLQREHWTSLDGVWDFALDPEARYRLPEDVHFDSSIEVPFAPETPRSGIGNTGLYDACWYRRDLPKLEREEGDRILIHFGAVDYSATVWVDGRLATAHEGGYTPFSADITHLLREDGCHELVVRAEDDPTDLAKPRGKQDWQLEPHSIWYPRTTGIWQTVWLERVPAAYVAALSWTPHLARWEVAMVAQIVAPPGTRYWLKVCLYVAGILLAEDSYSVTAGDVQRRIALSDPGIDDSRNQVLWSPSSPTLIEVEIELCDHAGARIDHVRSYTALRSFVVDGSRFLLNGRCTPLRMVLDQGYWPETGLTPPSDEALRRDVELTKAMGFNGARKHQKLEDPRYLYWADRLGLLVWTEMPSAYRFTPRSVQRMTRQWIEAIQRDVSHPCVIAWVPFNESWGVPNLPDSRPERHYVESIYHLTKTLDPTRPVIGNDGWESVATDVLGIHDYDGSPTRIARRYATPDLLPSILKRERPGGRALVVGGHALPELPVVLSEFGGIAVAAEVTRPGHDIGNAPWGYSVTATSLQFADRYREMLREVRALELLAGFCYTQLTDTYQEVNGLLQFDRTPKIPLSQIAEATVSMDEYAPRPSLTAGAITERGAAPQ